MRVTLLAFGVLREVLGKSTGPVELPNGSTVRDLLDRCRAFAPQGLTPWSSIESSIAVAVNREYVPATHCLADGDEVALLPPVSGGAPPRETPPTTIPVIVVTSQTVRLTENLIDPDSIATSLKREEDGALVLFDGIVRDNSRGRRTLYLFYESYPDMAIEQLKMLRDRALAEFPVRDIAIVHRLGRIQIGESSIVIAVASAHRAAAFDACRWLIDSIKKTVPIWKKEFFEDGAVWAQGDPFPNELTAHAPNSTPQESASKMPNPRAKTVKPHKRERAR
jgi:molybdopterin synthase catalytic subunit